MNLKTFKSLFSRNDDPPLQTWEETAGGLQAVAGALQTLQTLQTLPSSGQGGNDRALQTTDSPHSRIMFSVLPKHVLVSEEDTSLKYFQYLKLCLCLCSI